MVHGNVVKATAIDAATGIEASIVGPARRGARALAEAAVRKLKYVLEKRASCLGSFSSCTGLPSPICLANSLRLAA